MVNKSWGGEGDKKSQLSDRHLKISHSKIIT